MTAVVRPYQAVDREAVLQIGAETAFFGAPIEAYLEDRRIFMDAFYACYTDYEPQYAWVAANRQQVVGFLTGSIDTAAHGRIMRRKIMPGVMWKLVRGRYRTGPKTWRYMRAVWEAWRRGEIPQADEHSYPAHLHINLLPGYRGQGLGRQMIAVYLHQLAGLGAVGVHLHTTSMNRAACKLYEKMGFQLIGERPTQMYAGLISEPVANRCYGRRLGEGLFLV